MTQHCNCYANILISSFRLSQNTTFVYIHSNWYYDNTLTEQKFLFQNFSFAIHRFLSNVYTVLLNVMALNNEQYFAFSFHLNIFLKAVLRLVRYHLFTGEKKKPDVKFYYLKTTVYLQ